MLKSKEKILTKIDTNQLEFKLGGVSFDVTVINNSDGFATFQVELLADIAKGNISDDWYRISPDVCTKKPPGDSTTFTIRIIDIPKRGFAGVMTLTVRVFSLELPPSEESRQVIRLLIPGDGIPAPQIELLSQEFNRYPGEVFQIPISIESLSQKASKITLRLNGLDLSWFPKGRERDLRLPGGSKIREVFECQIPNDFILAESKHYDFTIEASQLDTTAVRVDGVVKVLPRGYVDFNCKKTIPSLADVELPKKNRWLFWKQYLAIQEFSLEFDNQSNLCQETTIKVIDLEALDKKNLKFPFWFKFGDTKKKQNQENILETEAKEKQNSSLTWEIFPEQANLSLNKPTNFNFKVQHKRPWFGWTKLKYIQAQAITSDDRIEVRNDTQTLELAVPPMLPLWLQLGGLLLGFLIGSTIVNRSFWLEQQHSQPVNSLRLSGLGREAVSGSNDQTIRRWLVQDNNLRPLDVLLRADKAVRVVRYRPVNNDQIAIGFENGEIQLVNLLSGEVSLPLSSNNQKDDRVFDLVFTKDSRSLFSGHGSGMVWQWNIQDGIPLNQRIQRSIQVGFAVNTLALVGPDENHVAIAGRFNQLTLWNLKNNQLQPMKNYGVDSQENYINSIATVDKKPYMIATADNQGSIKTWNLRSCLTGKDNCELIEEWVLDKQAIRSVAFSSDGCYLASAGDNGQAILWSLNSKGERRGDGQVIYQSSKPLKSIDLNRDRNQLLITTAGDDPQVRLHRVTKAISSCQ
ncbi:hypothetical protein [Calothrix sp. PCC 6303]|uniref:hypothetical protein n=1 Tax=Calothrix sp. PCC 6303 TaxID=1170562 RepID=UPI0002A02BAB|nr:hypothetical protein [Calothrix sp. PCC 6303]AFZ01383.1 WD-40 repeat-containing protein [Calothrix sp. PCC 6303]